jgi:hypothetical protein
MAGIKALMLVLYVLMVCSERLYFAKVDRYLSPEI